MRKRKPYQEQREHMVRAQIESRGIKDPMVLKAMGEIPRQLFVPPEYRSRSYDDAPLPIGEGQTISQPYMVAWMTELLRLGGNETVLEVGTGSGYQTAVLAKIARKVYSVERIQALAERARATLEEMGFDNVEVVLGNGSLGLPDYAPFDGIMVTAGAPEVPRTLIGQLADGGLLVVPVGSSYMQMLTVVEKREEQVSIREEGSCVFVPLVGRYGWRE